MAEVIFAITSAVKDVCGKPPSERLFLDKYGRICLCLDEIVWKVELQLNFLAACAFLYGYNYWVLLMHGIMLSILALCLRDNIMLRTMSALLFLCL